MNAIINNTNTNLILLISLAWLPLNIALLLKDHTYVLQDLILFSLLAWLPLNIALLLKDYTYCPSGSYSA